MDEGSKRERESERGKKRKKRDAAAIQCMAIKVKTSNLSQPLTGIQSTAYGGMIERRVGEGRGRRALCGQCTVTNP